MADKLPALSGCPHCGEPGEYRIDQRGGRNRYRVVCTNLNCLSCCKFYEASEAAAYWNRRTACGAVLQDSKTVHNIHDHVAYMHSCGSVHFNLLRSGRIECAGCGEVLEHTVNYASEAFGHISYAQTDEEISMSIAVKERVPCSAHAAIGAQPTCKACRERAQPAATRDSALHDLSRLSEEMGEEL